MNERVDAFANMVELPAFTTKPKAGKPVAEETITQLAEDNGFPSRQPAKPAKSARRKPRIHRTGRNQQFNVRAKAETVAKIYKIADEKGVLISEVLELAIEALEREGALNHKETSG